MKKLDILRSMNSKLIMFFCLLMIGCRQSENLKKTYFKNGKLQSTYYVDEEGKKHGFMTEYFNDGSIERKKNYIHGSLDGVSLRYDMNGNLLEKGKFIKDRPIGSYFFYEDGKLKSEIKFDDLGSKTSEVIYDESGNILHNRFYYVGTGRIASEQTYTSNSKTDVKESLFISINNIDDSYEMTFFGLRYPHCDSVVVSFLNKYLQNEERMFNSSNIIKSYTFYKVNGKLLFDKMLEFNERGNCNMLIKTYGSFLDIPVFVQTFPFQITKKKQSVESNLYPIYYNR